MPIVLAALAVLVLAAFVVLAGATTYRYGRHDLLHPVVLVNGIMAYYVLIPAAYFLYTGMRAIPARFDIVHPTRALSVALAVLFGMYVIILVAFRYSPWRQSSPRGSRSRSRSGVANITDTVADAFADVNPGVVLVLGLVGFGVGVVSYGLFVWLNGGLIRMLTVTPRTAFYTVPNTLRFQILGMVGVFGGYATVLCALCPALERPESSLSTHLSHGVLAILGITTALTMFVAVSTRARMVILVPALILIVYLHTAGWLSRRTLTGFGAAVVTVGVSFSLIEGLVLGNRAGITLSALLNNVVHAPRFALVMVLVESVPGEVFFQLGATLPNAFYFDLPGLPNYGNLLERIALGVDKRNHTSSAMLPGELWLNFGPVGIVVGGALYGAALRWAYRLREATAPLMRGVQPAVFACILLLWPTNLTWGIRRLFIRFLVPVLVAVVVARIIQWQFPAITRTIYDRPGTNE